MLIEALQILVLSIGTLFFLLGSVGLLRFPDVYTRLHATTKCDTLGLGMILMGALLHEGITLTSMKLVFIIIFVFLTNPIAAHAIARAAYRHGTRLWEKSVVDMYAGALR